MKVRVTARDIKDAKPFDPGNCAIALACMRSLGFRVYVNAHGPVGTEFDTTGAIYYIIPIWTHDAEDFANAFDDGQKVKPRTVTLTRVKAGK